MLARVCVLICVSVCFFARTHVHTRVRMFACICLFVRVFVFVYMQCVRVCLCVCLHAYVCVQVLSTSDVPMGVCADMPPKCVGNCEKVGHATEDLTSHWSFYDVFLVVVIGQMVKTSPS